MSRDESMWLRHRIRTERSSTTPSPVEDAGEEVVWGKTPDGTVFRVPTTYDVLTALFHPMRPKSHLDILNLVLLSLQILLTAYDGGLGWILTKQSKQRWIVREIQRLGWLNENKRPHMYAWIRDQLQGKMGKDYSFDSLPVEYNAWLLFRQLVDIILVNDFLSYTFFAFSCFRIPDALSTLLHLLRWVSGIALIAFNIWVKKEAHHVVKDYGWYWGDVFFERGALVFDGVFEMAPHPMYSVGYAGYYGLSLISGSYPVLFASLAAHMAQFAFLVFFENPHIERMYGQRKLMSLRTPVVANSGRVRDDQPDPTSPPISSAEAVMSRSRNNSIGASTPSVTDGDTASETEAIDTEPDDEMEGSSRPITPRQMSRRASPIPSAKARARRQSASQHDLLARFFRKDPIGLRNLDMFRAGDVKLVLLVFYVSAAALIPELSSSQYIILHFIHASFWRIFHSFGLGLLLKAQSDNKYMVRHFMKHYYYLKSDIRRGPLAEAFNNWKSLYNMSLCLTYVSFMALTWATYVKPANWISGDPLLRHIFGSALILLHLWTAVQSYEVLGVFGWFFGDFFIDEYPATLDYTGIYRYLNNPERTMSGAAFFGMAVISGSKVVFTLAIISHLSHWWFLSNVEDPHMRKLYGPSLRKEAGLTKTIKKMAIKNAKLLEATPASRYTPDLRHFAEEFRGTVEKVYEETTDVIEDLLIRSTPKLSDVVQDTKVLIQQSREKLVIPRLAQDISRYDVSKYELRLVSGRSMGDLVRFALGEPIKVQWRAPANHSRRDWVGAYRVGANKSTLETRTTSLGVWRGVCEDEWDGNLPVGVSGETSNNEEGVLTFSGDRMPWQVGLYELRYHHDGKHNVMSMGGPFEIYASKPTSFDFQNVRSCLLTIITLCLDADPTLVPVCTQAASGTPPSEDDDAVPSSDDFRFWSQKQAKRIAYGIKMSFGVECSYEVVLADANATTLTNRILAARELSGSS